MSGIISDPGVIALLRLLAAVALTAASVKLMDDCLDRERDAAAGRPNWASALGGSAPAYALACLALAGLSDALAAGTLFLSAYALGMAWGREGAPALQPSRLRGWQEALLAAGAGAVAAGTREMFGALCVMFTLQAADDLYDGSFDARRGGAGSGASRVEIALAGAAAGLLAVFLTPAKALAALLIGGLIIGLTGGERRPKDGVAA